MTTHVTRTVAVIIVKTLKHVDMLAATLMTRKNLNSKVVKNRNCIAGIQQGFKCPCYHATDFSNQQAEEGTGRLRRGSQGST